MIYIILFLIYATEQQSIVSYDLFENKKINEIKKSHIKNIYNLRYILDDENKRDLILSLSYDNNIKVWNVLNFECIVDLKNINKEGDIYIFS